MKRQHLLYLALLPILYLIYQVQSSYSSDGAFFYGFAENKETELSHDSDVLVTEIFVTQGEAVKKGQIVMMVSRAELASKEIDSELQEASDLLELDNQKSSLRDEQKMVQSELAAYLAKKTIDKEAIRARELQNRTELQSIKSIEVDAQSVSDKALAQLKSIDQEIASYQNEAEVKLQQINSKLLAIAKSEKLSSKKIHAKRQQIANDYKQLEILAPTNGVIGNIQSKKGEYIKAFSTLMTFYKENPTLVKGYVHEQFILEVRKGDTLLITSTLRPENVISGQVVGLGSRIIEIPERLRKVPTVKTYGREVLLEIHSDNNFLQKEKVSINSAATTGEIPHPLHNPKLEKNLKKELSIK